MSPETSQFFLCVYSLLHYFSLEKFTDAQLGKPGGVWRSREGLERLVCVSWRQSSVLVRSWTAARPCFLLFKFIHVCVCERERGRFVVPFIYAFTGDDCMCPDWGLSLKP